MRGALHQRGLCHRHARHRGGYATRLGGRAAAAPRPGREEFAELTYDPAARRIDGRINHAERADRRARGSAGHALAPLRFRSRQPDDHCPIPRRTARRPELRHAADLAGRCARISSAIWAAPTCASSARRCTKGRRALRFEAGGPAFGARGGPIWFDAAEGHILEASWGIPNHSEYRDFRLRLTGVSDGGAGGMAAAAFGAFRELSRLEFRCGRGVGSELHNETKIKGDRRHDRLRIVAVAVRPQGAGLRRREGDRARAEADRARQQGSGIPRGEPVRQDAGLRDGDFAISDSSAIVAYLEAVKPEPNLIPTEPRARARTIWFDEYADTILFACGGKMFFNRIVAPRFLGQPGDEEIAAKAECEELPPLLDYLERVIPESGFLVEDRLTLADIAVASPFANLQPSRHRVDPEPPPEARAPMSRRSWPGRASRPGSSARRPSSKGPPPETGRRDRQLPRPCLFRRGGGGGGGAGAARGGCRAVRGAARHLVGQARSARTTGRCSRSPSRPNCSRPWCPG